MPAALMDAQVLFIGEVHGTNEVPASDGSREQRKALLSGFFWQRDARMQDGRSSAAMLELLETARRHRRAGGTIEVLAVDIARSRPPEIPPAEYGKQRSHLMGTYLASRARPERTHLVLMGNYHAAKGRPGSAASAVGDNAVALLVRDRGGESWMCAPACGVSKFPGSYEDIAFDGRIALVPVNQGGGRYDGTVHVGRVTASAPARDAAPR